MCIRLSTLSFFFFQLLISVAETIIVIIITITFSIVVLTLYSSQYVVPLFLPLPSSRVSQQVGAGLASMGGNRK